MQHVFRAEKLATSNDEKTLATIRAGGDLSAVRSEAGCNMLLVYLLKRWALAYEPRGPETLVGSEDFQNAVIDAYVHAGCSPDEAAPAKRLHDHTSSGFRHMVQFRRKLSAVGFIDMMAKELDGDAFPELHAQLARLTARLASHADGTFRRAVDRAPDAACAFLARGARVTVDDEKLRALREAAAPLGLAVLVAGDPPEGAPADVVVGHRIAAVTADDGAPLCVTGLVAPPLTSEQAGFIGSLGEVATFLVASGPLASCSLVRGTLGERERGGAGRFVVGADMQQNPHRTGVYGEVLLTADSTPRPCELPPGELYLVARYD